MVNGSGEYEKIAIEPGLFAIVDIPEIVKLGSNNSGWRPETTAQSYPILRNGFNCRHFLVFTFLSDDEAYKADRARLKAAINQLMDFKVDY
jgi:hypothetical protein